MDEDLAALVKDDTRDKMGKAIDHVTSRDEQRAHRPGLVGAARAR